MVEDRKIFRRANRSFPRETVLENDSKALKIERKRRKAQFPTPPEPQIEQRDDLEGGRKGRLTVLSPSLLSFISCKADSGSPAKAQTKQNVSGMGQPDIQSQSRFPHSIQYRDRCFQKGPSLPFQSRPFRPQFPRLRTNLEEFTDDTSDGQCEGRIRFRSNRGSPTAMSDSSASC
jgi:hypothetical protein